MTLTEVSDKLEGNEDVFVSGALEEEYRLGCHGETHVIELTICFILRFILRITLFSYLFITSVNAIMQDITCHYRTPVQSIKK